VHSFFVVDDMSKTQYESDREMQADMIVIGYEESCLLISDAYKFNVRFMSRPALGKFLYQKYLDEKLEFTNININTVLRKLSPTLLPGSWLIVFSMHCVTRISTTCFPYWQKTSSLQEGCYSKLIER